MNPEPDIVLHARGRAQSRPAKILTADCADYADYSDAADGACAPNCVCSDPRYDGNPRSTECAASDRAGAGGDRGWEIAEEFGLALRLSGENPGWFTITDNSE
jgi:hypothetical protein